MKIISRTAIFSLRHFSNLKRLSLANRCKNVPWGSPVMWCYFPWQYIWSLRSLAPGFHGWPPQNPELFIAGCIADQAQDPFLVTSSIPSERVWECLGSLPGAAVGGCRVGGSLRTPVGSGQAGGRDSPGRCVSWCCSPAAEQGAMGVLWSCFC